MRGIDRQAIRTTLVVVATKLHLTLQLVVTGLAQGLEVGRIEEEITVTLMGNDMIDNGGRGWCVRVEDQTEPASRFLGQLSGPEAVPPSPKAIEGMVFGGLDHPLFS